MKNNSRKTNLFYILILIIVIGLFSTTSFAESNENNLVLGEIDLENLQDKLDVSNDYDMKIHFTFDELIDEMAKNADITRDEALKRVYPKMNKSSRGEIEPLSRYRMYVTFTRYFKVNNNYSPSVSFYCEVRAVNGRPANFIKVLDVSMNRRSKGLVKNFDGSIFINLEDSLTLFYRINGNFYNTGTTTVGIGGTVGVGDSASIKFNASHTSNFYDYHYSTSRIRR